MSYFYERRYSLGLGGRLTHAVKILLIANVAAFFLQLIIKHPMLYLFGLNPHLVFKKFMIWQLVTYMFLHGGFWHLFFNMFVLWIFGSEVEREWGSREFFKYYFITGIGAGIFNLLFLWAMGSPAITIGASGAVYGVLTAFGMLYPDRIVTLLLFFVFPVSLKAKHLVLFVFGISLLMGVSNLFGTSGGIAHFAHLGGMVVGYLYLKSDWRLSILWDYLKRRREMRRFKMRMRKEEERQRLQAQIDRILDKINEVGYENLSDQEKKILKEASKFFSKH